MTQYILYEGRDTNLKIKTKSFKFKLWMYFVLFTAMIFIVLWLLQTVFLQSFYDAMVISNTRKAAEQIIAQSSSSDINDKIDRLAKENSLLIFIISQDNDIYYASDSFNGMRKKDMRDDLSESTGQVTELKQKQKRHGGYRLLPETYYEFLTVLLSSESGLVEYRSDDIYTCGSYIDYYGSYDSDEKAVLYVSASIDAVGSSVNIISMQLVWVTILSVIAGFILSWFIAKRFAAPVDRLSEKARLLGENEYTSDFSKGFCSELDELSDTLDKTNVKLLQAKDYQMELLANVSHDLRTPITMIKGYAEMIRDISWEDKEQSSQDLAIVIKEADRLTALVNEIMEYSELKTNDDRDELVPTDISRIAEKTADSFRQLYKHEGIVVETDIQKNIIVNGSSSRLERAFYNLMDNAFRHTGESKKIVLKLSADDGIAKAEVTDFGNGIPESELELIWDRYYTSRKRKGKGVSGLGLAIVKQITEMHGGKCSAISQTGKGSTFIIELPAVNG